MNRRNIDFLVFGVPRSGTTALTEVLNLHPEIFCGMEVLRLDASSHLRVEYPNTFLNTKHLTNRQRRMVGDAAENKANPSLLGNKQPRYYLHLNAFTKALPEVKLVYLYRSPQQYCSSWNRRAESANMWHKGQTGVFGIMELLVCLESLNAINRPVLVVPYQSVFFENSDAIDKLVGYLGLEIDKGMKEKFLEGYFSRSSVANKEKGTGLADESLLAAIDAAYLDTLLNKNEPYEYSSVKDDVVTYLEKVKPRAIDQFNGIAQTFNENERNYEASWRRLKFIRDVVLEKECDSVGAKLFKYVRHIMKT